MIRAKRDAAKLEAPEGARIRSVGAAVLGYHADQPGRRKRAPLTRDEARALCRLAEMRRLAQWRTRHGVLLIDRGRWLAVAADALNTLAATRPAKAPDACKLTALFPPLDAEIDGPPTPYEIAGALAEAKPGLVLLSNSDAGRAAELCAIEADELAAEGRALGTLSPRDLSANEIAARRLMRRRAKDAERKRLKRAENVTSASAPIYNIGHADIFVTLNDLAARWGLSGNATRQKLHRWQQSGRAERIGRGLYRLIDPKPAQPASPDIEALIADWNARLAPVLEALASLDEIMAPVRRAAHAAGAFLDQHTARAAQVSVFLDGHATRAAAACAAMRAAAHVNQAEEFSGSSYASTECGRLDPRSPSVAGPSNTDLLIPKTHDNGSSHDNAK